MRTSPSAPAFSVLWLANCATRSSPRSSRSRRKCGEDMAKPIIKPYQYSVRHGDNVKVIAGRAKGRTGKVLAVNFDKQTVTVEHAAMIKKHTRPNPSKNIKGGILEKEGPI